MRYSAEMRKSMKRKVIGMITVCMLATALAACGTKDEPIGGEATMTPVVTEGSIVTETPKSSASPEISETPAVTETPKASEAPESTKAPEETKASEETQASEKTKASKATKAPAAAKSQATPKSSKKPPKASKKPAKEQVGTKNLGTTKKPEKEEEKESVKDASEAYEKAVAGVELPSMVDITEDMLADAYGIDSSLLKSYVVKLPMMNVKADEIAVFQVKKEKNVAAVKEGIQKRQEALEENWKHYLPDQYELVQNYQIVVQGNYVLFVISSDADEIVSNFKSAFAS